MIAGQGSERTCGEKQRNSIAGTAELRYAEAMVWNERQRQRVDWLRVAKEQLSLDMRCEGLALRSLAENSKGDAEG